MSTLRAPIVLALGSSLLAHVASIGVVAVAAGSLPRVGRRALDAQYLTPRLELEVIEDPDPEYQPPDEAPAERIVDAPETDERGEHADTPRFAASRTTFAKQETRSRVRVVSPSRIASATPSAPGEGPHGEVEPAPPRGGGGTPLRLTEPSIHRDPAPSRPGLFGIQVPDGSDREGSTRLPVGSVEPGPPGPPGPPMPQLRPTLGNLRDAIRGTGLEDLEDLEEADRTALNAVEWRHAPFFARVQTQVEQYWRPGEEYAEHDPTGHVYGYRDRETVLKVVLNRDGSLRGTYVIEESGAAFLDDEAREAVEQAAPFPHPPRGLIDPDTNVVAFRFSFTVQINESPVIRMERMPE